MWDLFYRYPRFLMLTILCIIVSGLAAYSVLPRREDPPLTSRLALISTRFPGASAEHVEALVTTKIEEELLEIDAIAEINSTSRAGISVISVKLRDEVVDGEAVWSRLRDRLSDVTPTLPQGASAPKFNNTDTQIDAYTLIVGLTWDQESAPSYAILRRLAVQLEDELQRLPGTRHTRLFGDPQEEILVTVPPHQLATHGLSSADVARSIARSDAKVAAGQVRGSHNDMRLEVAGAFEALQHVRQTPIRSGSQGQVVQLGDIATVTKSIADPPSALALIDGKPGIAIAVRMTTTRRIDRWAQQAQHVLERFRQQLTPGIGLHLIFDQNHYVTTRWYLLQRDVLFGAGLVMLVMLGTMGWKSALLVGLALPLSSLMVLAGLRLLGIPIHQMSVTGLIIALGMVVDNAIVVVDHVRKQLRQGKTAAQAVADSVRELCLPLLSCTVTTMLSFMPLVLLPGSVGEFVGSVGLSVILALSSSLFVALTIVAALTGLVQHPADMADKTAWWRGGFSPLWLTRAYSRTLRFFLVRPGLCIVLALALPAFGFLKSRALPQQFFPPADRDQFQIQLTLPSHASLAQTQTYARAVRQMILYHPEVANVHWFIGESAPKFYYNLLSGQEDAAFFAQALVQLHSATVATRLIHTLQAELDQHFPAAQVIVKALEQGPPFAAPIELHLYGPDLERLQHLGERVQQELAQVSDVVHTQATLRDGKPKLTFQLDAEATRLVGLDNVGVAEQLQNMLEGARGGSLIEATEELPVRLRMPDSHRKELTEIAALDLVPWAPAAVRHRIPLTTLGQFRLVPELASIPHRGGERVNTIRGFLTAEVLPARVLEQFQARLQAAPLALPPDYRYEIGGEAAQRDTAVDHLLASVGVLLVLMATTLVLTCQSFRIAGIMASIAGLSVGLALVSLWIFGSPFGFTALVGTMGLVGIAVNEAIVMLVAFRHHPQARLGEPEAMHAVILDET